MKRKKKANDSMLNFFHNLRISWKPLTSNDAIRRADKAVVEREKAREHTLRLAQRFPGNSDIAAVLASQSDALIAEYRLLRYLLATHFDRNVASERGTRSAKARKIQNGLEARRNKVEKLYKADVEPKDISDRLSTPLRTVYNDLEARGLKKRKNKIRH